MQEVGRGGGGDDGTQHLPATLKPAVKDLRNTPKRCSSSHTRNCDMVNTGRERKWLNEHQKSEV